MTTGTSHARSAATVVAVASSATHAFSKATAPSIRLLAGLGVEGDAHAGVTVRHRSRVKRNPQAPNLRQVHLVHAELFEMLADRGYRIEPGDIGENVTTRGIDLLGLGTGTRLALGATAVIEVTGLRNPCAQLDAFEPGLTGAVLRRDEAGRLERLAGVMAVVIDGGNVTPGDPIRIVAGSDGGDPLEPV